MSQQIEQISLDLIDDPRIAMRTELDGEEMDELMRSMRELGLLEPVVLRIVGDRYEVIAGHRRTRAARRLNWPHIASIVHTTDDNTAFAMRVAENLARKDIDPVDEAMFIGEIILHTKKEPAEVAAMLKRSVQWAEERLEIFNMPDYMKEHLKFKRYPLGAALWISRIEKEAVRSYYANWAAIQGVSVAGAKMWYLNIKANNTNINLDELQPIDEGGQMTKARTIIKCGACQTDLYLDEAESVFCHKVCP